MEKSIFELIIEGQIPSMKIYEDEKYIAFLDIQPKQKGHTLLVPKLKKVNIIEENDDVKNDILIVGTQIAKKLKESLGATSVKFVMNCGSDAGQEVFHTHLHIVPYYDSEVEAVNNEDVLKEILNYD